MTRRARFPDHSVRQAAAEFIDGLAEWDWWITLTFSRWSPSERRAHALRDRWLRCIARQVVRDHLMVAWAGEAAALRVPHFHMVLSLPWDSEVFDPDLGRRLWRCMATDAGHTRIARFERPRAGARYMVEKHLLWDVRVVCPRLVTCRRRHGCRVISDPL